MRPTQMRKLPYYAMWFFMWAYQKITGKTITPDA